MADGRAIALALEMDSGAGAPVLQPLRLPGVQLLAPELEPRLFSFNSPVGACPTCDGLGQHGGVRPGAGGGLPVAEPGQRRHQGLGPAQRLLLRAAGEPGAHYGFDIEAPFERCPPVQAGGAARLGRPKTSSSATPGRRRPEGQGSVKKHPFEGILPNMERRYRETDSTVVREELARYQRPALPRLRRHAPAPRGAPREAWTTGAQARRHLRGEPCHAAPSALDYFERLQLPAPRPRSPTRWCARSARG
jgi:excinuclease ABC subunit A